jgi:hypothetical protein
MAGGASLNTSDGSTPFSSISGGVNQQWLNNLYLFFQDLRAANIRYVALRIVAAGGWSSSETMAYQQYCTLEVLGSDGKTPVSGSGTGPVQPCTQQAPAGYVPVQLVCYPWLPWCNINTLNSQGNPVENCYGCNDPTGYNDLPYLPQSLGAWPWVTNSPNPFVTWFDYVLQRAQWAQLTIREVVLVDEAQLSQTPVLARMIFDNVNTVASGGNPPDSILPGAILGFLGQEMPKYGFDPGAVILSSESWNPPYSQTCNTGTYGDSGLMIDVSELWTAMAGGPFGVVDNYGSTTGNLLCGSGFQAPQYLPFTFNATVFDIHAYPADEVNDPSSGWIANPNDSTFPGYQYPDDINPIDPNGASGSSQDAANKEYSAMAAFAQNRAIYYNGSQPTVIVGETDTNSPLQAEGQPGPDAPDGKWHRPDTPNAANENAIGFNLSSLPTQTVASVVLRPFDPMNFGSVVIPAPLGPPTTGPYEAGSCSYSFWEPSGSWTFSASTTGFGTFLTTGQNCQWSIAPPPPANSQACPTPASPPPCPSIPSWFTLVSPIWQTGSGGISANLSANTSSSPRSFQLLVAGQPITVTQNGAGGTVSGSFYDWNGNLLSGMALAVDGQPYNNLSDPYSFTLSAGPHTVYGVGPFGLYDGGLFATGRDQSRHKLGDVLRKLERRLPHVVLPTRECFPL